MSKMRGKPDLSGLTSPKDPTAFLEAGMGDIVKASPSSSSNHFDTEQEPPIPVVQKLFRLRWDIANTLKADALKESMKTGKRVTETQIIERLLKDYYEIKD